MDNQAMDEITAGHSLFDHTSTTYIPPTRSLDPECVDVAELLANWLAPEVS